MHKQNVPQLNLVSGNLYFNFSYYKYTVHGVMFALLSNYVAYLFCLHVWAQVAFNISKSNMSSTMCHTRRVE